MTRQVRLVLALHNHQPVGNFDSVFEAAYRDSYAPFLTVLEQYPDLPIALHISGSLLEWLVEHHAEYIDRVRAFVERGQIEIIGGPFYEPILACIPRRDRVGQMSAYKRYLEQHFGAQVRGMWVPERVWEQSFAGDISAAGIEYTILDDFHFRSAGVPQDQLFGYYLTEDEGRLLKIFPGSERLRYTIPFADPQVTIDYLRSLLDKAHSPVAVLGDDGEKFGTWPGTSKHVYADGWLRRFFDALRANSDWLKVTTLAETVDGVAPFGRCYLPDASYREMTEWALPTDNQKEYQQLVKRKQSDPDWSLLQLFMRGGFWRNFRVKYPESSEMYARMLYVSSRLEALEQQPGRRERADLVSEARAELYRGQCNCPYWHGAFGGLYLPHLRNAIYHHLIHADSLLEQASGRSGRWVEIEAADFNLDARKEVRMAGDRLVAWLAPSRGGHLYELDVRSTSHNLLATLNRRPEPYHQVVLEAGSRDHHDNGHVASIHDAVRFKQPDLDKKIAYDQWPRKSLVDHFLEPGLSLQDFQRGGGQVGDFVQGVYETRLQRSDERVQAAMARDGQVGAHRVRVTKTVALDVRSGGRLEVQYQLEQLPRDQPIHFAVEFNFAGMAAGAPDRYFYDNRGRQLGQLETTQALGNLERIGLIDEWLGLDAGLEFSQPAGVWTFPIQTISQSEGGFELVHQSSCVVPHWEFIAPRDGRWSVSIQLSLDTSAAQARELAKAAVVG
jgi:alpha-amylase